VALRLPRRRREGAPAGAPGLDPGTRRRLIEGGTRGAGILLVAALFVILNYFGWKYHWRYDWTASRLYTLSERTEQLLDELEGEVEVTVFLQPTHELYDPVRELLSRYEARSPRIAVRYVDPQRNLAEAQRLVERYELTRGNVVVFERAEDRRVVEAADLADYDYSGMQFGQPPEMTGFKGEQMFSSAILELAESEKPRVLFTTGHGEAKLDDPGPAGLSQAQDLLGRDNLEIEEWASLGAEEVPERADLVVVAGPTASFVEPELRLLADFLAGGGRLLLLLDPLLSGSTGGGAGLDALGEWLGGYGVTMGGDIVVDPANPLPFFGAETIFAGAYGEHSIVEPLQQAGVPVILALARSVRAGGEVVDLAVTELLHTSAEGWGETDLEKLDRVEKGPDDLAGPVALGVAVEKKAEEPAAGATPEGPAAGTTPEEAPPALAEAAPSRTLRAVVLGDSDFARNSQLASAGNEALLANAVNWLVEREVLLALPPKQPEQARLNLAASQLRLVFWLVVGILPGLAVAVGVAVYLRRRR
jgi:ABC-type uncharacterized transport system involved in gliding motility auxiliary subunit